jgi:RimJ/RimL family protein N-acetyltransferase
LATEGARAVIAFAHAELGLAEVVSMTSALNIRSQRVMQKIGMLRDPADDFAHSRLPVGHRLRPHVLYRHRA